MDLDKVTIVADGDGCRLAIRVKPGGRADRIAGVHGTRLKVEVRAPPERGKANAAVCVVLAAALDVASADVAIIAGATNRDKTARIRNRTAEQVRQRFVAILHPG